MKKTVISLNWHSVNDESILKKLKEGNTYMVCDEDGNIYKGIFTAHFRDIARQFFNTCCEVDEDLTLESAYNGPWFYNVDSYFEDFGEFYPCYNITHWAECVEIEYSKPIQ